MAILDPYITLGELKEYAQVTDSVDDDDVLERIMRGVSRGINRFCHRQFNDAGTVSARTYWPTDPYCVDVDDFSTSTGLIVKTDTGDDGLYATTLPNTYNLLPLNGIIDGEPGYPFNRIRLHSSATSTFPLTSKRPGVQVTARWGWAAVPPEVQQACLIMSTRVFRRRFAPDGLVGQGDFVFRVSREKDPDVVQMLAPLDAVGGVIA